VTLRIREESEACPCVIAGLYAGTSRELRVPAQPPSTTQTDRIPIALFDIVTSEPTADPQERV